MVPANCEGDGVSVCGGGADSVGWGGGSESPQLSGYSAVQLCAAVCDGGEDRGAGMADSGLADGAGPGLCMSSGAEGPEHIRQ